MRHGKDVLSESFRKAPHSEFIKDTLSQGVNQELLHFAQPATSVVDFKEHKSPTALIIEK